MFTLQSLLIYPFPGPLARLFLQTPDIENREKAVSASREVLIPDPRRRFGFA
jgi:hypothetical protein